MFRNSSVVKIYTIRPKPGPFAKNAKVFRLGIEPASSGLLDQCFTTELQKPLTRVNSSTDNEHNCQIFISNGMIAYNSNSMALRLISD